MASSLSKKILLTLGVAGAGILARKTMNAAWEKGSGREAPNKKRLNQGDWKEIIMWTAASGAIAGLARLAALEGIHRVAGEGAIEDAGEVGEAAEEIEA
ncbi:DUF4235 domain-containing protein [Cerasicoccus fimbriatus]|uniref:DUF4235 domain-containing protein n=1 Tax=Cerasicoccus fimbriatus TaxID=3014554 RepID=UPI0022B51D8C|nr:DUF4235 domain-containing protein [Cerasicoccus sp. TK19100]